MISCVECPRSDCIVAWLCLLFRPRNSRQIDLAFPVREMRKDAGLIQAELATKVGTTQSVIARLEDAKYTGHSLTMLEHIATAWGVALKLHAEKKPNFDREVTLV